MIHPISYAQLRNAEYLQFTKNLTALITPENANTLGVTKPLTGFSGSIAAIEAAFKLEQSNPLTVKIVQLDDKRDALLTGIWRITEGYLLHFNPNMAAQATTLHANLSKYSRDIIKLSYPAETANINSLVKDWETKPELAAAATALYLTEWKDELKATNASFETTYSDRAKVTGDTAVNSPVKEARIASVKLLDKLTTTLKAQFYLNEDDAVLAPKYQQLFNSMNALIDTYANIITLRQAKSKTDKGGAGTTTS